ncbi:MAG: hypothetical protein ABL956_17720, partial [Hyphomonadaceae bacterium]
MARCSIRPCDHQVFRKTQADWLLLGIKICTERSNARLAAGIERDAEPTRVALPVCFDVGDFADAGARHVQDFITGNTRRFQRRH